MTDEARPGADTQDALPSPDEATTPVGYIPVELDKLPPELAAQIQEAQGGDLLVTTSTVTAQQSYRGPIPDPHTLAGYRELVPDAPERILRMAETSMEHGRKMDREASSRATVGQWMGFVGLVLLIGGAFYALSEGDTAAVAIFLGAAALGVIGRFLPVLTGSRSDD